MTDLAHQQPTDVEVADLLARSDLVPSAFRGKPANVYLALMMGRSVGLDPATSLQAITVVDGKPALSAAAMGALVRKAGHRLRVEGDDTHATAVLIRADDPEHEHRSVWTIDRARTAGLTGKGAWRTYPQAMLQARAISEVCRLAASDVLLGLAHSSDELADAPAVVEPLAVVAGEVVDTTTGEVTAPATAMDATRDAMGLPRRERPATPGQLRAIGARLGQVNVRDAEHRHATISVALGLPDMIRSAHALTFGQAWTFLDLDRDDVTAAAAAAWELLVTTDVAALELHDDDQGDVP